MFQLQHQNGELIEAEWCIYASIKHINIASGNGLLPVQHQVVILTNAAILSIRPQGTYFDEIWFKIQKFSFKEINLKMSSVKWQPFCLGLNVFGVVQQIQTDKVPQH